MICEKEVIVIERLYRFLGCLFFLVWTIIGLVVILGSVALVVAVKNTDFSKFSPQSIVERAIENKIGQGDGPTQEEIDCSRKVLGDSRLNELMASKTEPTPEEMEKLKVCFPQGLPDKGDQSGPK